MKIAVLENLRPLDVLRRAGYGSVNDRRASEPSWARRLGSGFYPRFHAYISAQVINLHLDQKQASYEGYSAHSGEYDGETVAAEAERIIQVMDGLANENQSAEMTAEAPEKSGFWSKFFG